jgi:hypothetical protein
LSVAVDRRLRGPVVAALAAVPLVVFMAVAFRPSLSWLVERWSASDGYFSHGPLVPVASAWLVWSGRARLRAARGGGSWWASPDRAGARARRRVGVAAQGLAGRARAPLRPAGLRCSSAAASAARARLPARVPRLAWPLPMFAVVEAIDLLKRIVVPASCALVNLFGAGVRARGRSCCFRTADGCWSTTNARG